MDYADEELFNILDPKNVILANTVNKVDIVFALEEAIKHFEEITEPKTTFTEKIIILSNFSNIEESFVKNEENFKDVIFKILKNLNTRNIKLEFTGLNVDSILVKNTFLSPIIKYCNTKILLLKDEIDKIGKFLPIEHSQIARYHGSLTFKNYFSINISCYPYIIKENLPKFKSFSKIAANFDVPYDNCEIKTESYKLDFDDNQISKDFVKKSKIFKI